MRFEGVQLFEKLLCLRKVLAEGSLQNGCIGKDLAHFSFTAIKAHMHLAVEIPSDNAAGDDNEHCDHCDGCIQGGELPVRMGNNERGADNSENHMNPEPGRNPSKCAQNTQALSQRIEKQHQYRDAARDAEPIAYTSFGRQMAFISLRPSCVESSKNDAAEKDGCKIEEGTAQIMGEPCCYLSEADPAPWLRLPTCALAVVAEGFEAPRITWKPVFALRRGDGKVLDTTYPLIMRSNPCLSPLMSV